MEQVSREESIEVETSFDSVDAKSKVVLLRRICVQRDLKLNSLIGFLVASIIIAFWIISLGLLSSIDIACLIPGWIVPAILGRTFIQTGLFIVAHDAIHGVVIPGDRRLNRWIGQLAVTLYALLSYQKLALNHWQHHQHPGQAGDPDFHDGIHSNIVDWYLKFMHGYLDSRQTIVLLLGIGSLLLTLHWGFQVPVLNLVLFWILPIVLSSMQLFIFGTYLPHRLGNTNGVENSHHTTSSHYPPVVSFLACYHFGYHWEHHEYFFLPWYSLPYVRQRKQSRMKLLCTQIFG